MSSGPDYILDIQGLSAPKPGGGISPGSAAGGDRANASGSSLTGRPWLSIHWKCCQTYSRVYRNAAGSAYEGRCPKRSSPVSFAVGEGGTSNRFFTAQ